MAVEGLRFTVGPWAGGVPTAEVTRYDGLSLTFNLADGCTAEFRMAANDPAARVIDELATDVWMLLDGQVYQRFRIFNVDQEWGEDGEDELSIRCGCYRRLTFRRRIYTDLTFTGVGQGSIIWGIIQDLQAAPGGDMGITVGSLDDTVVRDRTYLAGENAGQRIEELTEVIDGPWWRINPNNELVVASRDDFPVRSQPLVHGVNVRRMTRQSGADTFGNAAFVTGDDEHTTMVVAEAADIATDPRGRWDVGDSFGTVVQQTTLVEHALGTLQAARTPLAAWQLTLEPSRWRTDTDLRIGDICTLVQPRSTVAPIVPAQRLLVQVVDLGVQWDADGGLEVKATAVELGEVEE